MELVGLWQRVHVHATGCHCDWVGARRAGDCEVRAREGCDCLTRGKTPSPFGSGNRNLKQRFIMPKPAIKSAKKSIYSVHPGVLRSEERRVGKECRCGGSAKH